MDKYVIPDAVARGYITSEDGEDLVVHLHGNSNELFTMQKSNDRTTLSHASKYLQIKNAYETIIGIGNNHDRFMEELEKIIYDKG